MSRLHRFAIVIVLSLAATGSGRAQAAQAPATASLDSLIAARMAEVDIVGLAAAVIVDRQIVWMKGFGHRDWERSRPFTPNTIMNVGSVTKPLLGVAMMRAVQEGKLDLDADIDRYLPFRVVNPHRPSERITLRHLATHTSGITDRWQFYSTSYRFDGRPSRPLAEFLPSYLVAGERDYSPENFLAAKPGELREYSNIGASLAGYIVERIVGEPLNVYTRKHIFAPLGMASTGWFLDEIDLDDHSTLFVTQNGWAVPIPHYSLMTYPDGGVRTSVADLTKFFLAMLNDGEYEGTRILDARLAAEMLRFQFDDANRPSNFPAADGNSGLFWRTKYDGTRIGHGGNDPGVIVDMLSDRARQVGVVIIVNTSLAASERKSYGAIFDALWAHGEAVRASRDGR